LNLHVGEREEGEALEVFKMKGITIKEVTERAWARQEPYRDQLLPKVSHISVCDAPSDSEEELPVHDDL